jgi:hypothetical protein
MSATIDRGQRLHITIRVQWPRCFPTRICRDKYEHCTSRVLDSTMGRTRTRKHPLHSPPAYQAFSPEMITPHEHQAEHDGHDAEEGCGRGGAWCQRESITGVIHEDKDKDKDKEVEHRRQLRRDSQTGENDTDEKTSSSHHRRLIASSPRLTVKRNMHGKRRVVPRRVPRLEDLRTDNGAQSVGDEHEGEDCDFFGLAGCGEWGVSV